MKLSPISVDMVEVMNSLTMTVVVRQATRHRARIALGLIIMRVGAWVIGIGRVEVTSEP